VRVVVLVVESGLAVRLVVLVVWVKVEGEMFMFRW
jgi:hypothetical protein